MNDYNLPLANLAALANAYAGTHSVQVEKRRPEDPSSSYFECAPISLLPNAYPAQAFADAQAIAPALNVLVDRVSRDGDFLLSTLGGGVSEADPFTAQLLQLYRTIYLGDAANPHALAADRLGIHRSDYMLQNGQIKQVELNTIASSFAGLSSRVAKLHSFLCQRFAQHAGMKEFLRNNKHVVLGNDAAAATDGNADPGVPVNPTMECLPRAFHIAVERYKKRFQVDNVLVLFVVQEGETNTIDQRMLEFALFEQYQIPVVRRSLKQLHGQLECDPATGALRLVDNGDDTVDPTMTGEIAVVYYRAGYAPTDYPDGPQGVEWQSRERLELSRATKSPCLGYHLAGTKKVQQALARPGVLERFFPNHDVQSVRRAFAGLYSLGYDANADDLDAVRRVLQGEQGQFVLKPQREGGGYNFYGDKLAAKLRQYVHEQADGTLQLDKELEEFILMERLFPPQQKAILLRAGRIEGSGDSVSELGCYATVVASPDGIIEHNEYAGYLLRTKFSHIDEGGVASGFATLSSPYLCS